MQRGHILRHLFVAAAALCVARSPALDAAFDPTRGLLLTGTVITMNASRDVVPDARVLIRAGRIVAVWSGATPPPGVSSWNADMVELPAGALIFPGLINLHDHPFFDALPAWHPPTSHRQADRGRPTGTEPYANRYQWNTGPPPEYRRLVATPGSVLTDPPALNLSAEVVKFAEIRGLLGGETSMQGAPPNPASDGLLARNVDNGNFGRDAVDNRVGAIAQFTGAPLEALLASMRTGAIQAWIVHLAEGVRDRDRRAGDAVSSRDEFRQLREKGLLNDATVIVHGTALEYEDFVQMRVAPAARVDGQRDGRGAKLVWSPLSNLLLYGRTTNVIEAVTAGVNVSLGTDWSPSGTGNLLAELKIADAALRDPRLLGADRTAAGMPAGTPADDRRGVPWRRPAAAALDRLLVEMVTINPAQALRWDHELGSVEAGKAADLLVITPPSPRGPSSVYRSLIDATERDVRLVLVNGEPLVADVSIMEALKPGDFEVVASLAGCFEKAVDVTREDVPRGTQTLRQIVSTIGAGLQALGGDIPYMKARFAGTAGMSDAEFLQRIVIPSTGLLNGMPNIEAMRMPPLFSADDEWLHATVEGRAAHSAPYVPYPSNANHITAEGNPLARALSGSRCQ